MEYLRGIKKFILRVKLFRAVRRISRNNPVNKSIKKYIFIAYPFNEVRGKLPGFCIFYNANRQKPTMNFKLKFVRIENRLASLRNILERNGKEFYRRFSGGAYS